MLYRHLLDSSFNDADGGGGADGGSLKIDEDMDLSTK